jgi:hypothetical protein
MGVCRALAVILVVVAVAACAPAGSGSTASPAPPTTVRVTGHVTAGPTCPVERNPPDPSCAPRPVTGAEVRVVRDDAAGAVIAQAMTDATGAYTLDVPPGSYRLEGGAGMPGIAAPQPVPFTAAPGSALMTVDLPVDTGIR